MPRVDRMDVKQCPYQGAEVQVHRHIPVWSSNEWRKFSRSTGSNSRSPKSPPATSPAKCGRVTQARHVLFCRGTMSQVLLHNRGMHRRALTIGPPLFLVLRLHGDVGLAQAPTREVVSTSANPRSKPLDEARAYARIHQPGVRAALARIATEPALAQVPRAGWYPTVGAIAQPLVATVNDTTAS